MSQVIVPNNGFKSHKIDVGSKKIDILLRSYQTKPSWDKNQSTIPDGVVISDVTPWSEVEAYGTRSMKLTDSETGAFVTIEWTVATAPASSLSASAIPSTRHRVPTVDTKPELTIKALPGAVEARWNRIPNSSTYFLQWRTEDGQYEDINTQNGRRTRVTIDLGPSETRVFRVKASGKEWSDEVTTTTLAWTPKANWKFQPYEKFEAEHCWWAVTKPCWYDRENLIDMEVWFDDPNDELPPIIFQWTVGLSPKSSISEYLWKTDTPKQLTSRSAMEDNGRSIAQVEIERQASFLKNQRIRLEMERSGS